MGRQDEQRLKPEARRPALCSLLMILRVKGTESQCRSCLPSVFGLLPPACKASVSLPFAKGYRIVKSSFSLSALAQVFTHSSSVVRNRILGMYTLLLGFNLLAWIFAF